MLSRIIFSSVVGRMVDLNTSGTRDDISGLRALAVLLVIFNHFNFPGFSGGYIGVDVFFVISGFLITKLLLREISSGDFSFKIFFLRRIKRLFPLTFFVVLVTTFFFIFFFSKTEFLYLLHNAISSFFSLANIYSWRVYGGYFDSGAREAPFLHLWSLAVEEQYYILWPVFLVLLFRYVDKKYFFALFMFLLIFSIVISEYVTRVTIGAGYYLLPSRFFELLIGGVMVVTPRCYLRHISTYRNVISLLGVLLILMSAVLYDATTRFPGISALLPTIGTALFICSVGGVANRFLSRRFFVFLGLMSFSIYLWHWPVIVALHIFDIDSSLYSLLSAFGLIAFSYFSWAYVENPLRYLPVSYSSVFYYYFLIPVFCYSSFVFYFMYSDFSSWFYPSFISKMDYDISSDPNYKGCLSDYRSFDSLPKKDCRNIRDGGNRMAVVLGDSHANHLLPFVDYHAALLDISTVEYSLNACIPVFGLNWGAGPYQYSRCRARNDLAEGLVVKEKPEFVVLAGNWPRNDNTPIWRDDGSLIISADEKRSLFEEKLTETIKVITSVGSKVVIFNSVPGNPSYKCPLRRSINNSKEPCYFVDDSDDFSSGVFDSLLVNFPNVFYVDSAGLFCKAHNCNMMLDGVPLYHDLGHLNRKGAETLASAYLVKFGNIFLSKDN